MEKKQGGSYVVSWHVTGLKKRGEVGLCFARSLNSFVREEVWRERDGGFGLYCGSPGCVCL